MMPDVKTQLGCQQCGAPLAVEQDTRFVTCAFCQTTNFVDKSGAVLHYAVQETVPETEAAAALRRWMAGNDTVKDLDKKAQIDKPVFQFFPVWLVRARVGAEERVILKPGAALTVMELMATTIPAGNLEPFDQVGEDTAVEPTVPYETVQKWLAEDQGIAVGAIQSVSLVHLPIYLFHYVFSGRPYTAVVDAATSKVFASIYPSKWEAPYQTIGALGCIVYLFAAFIPLLSTIMAGDGGQGIGILIYFVVAAVLGIPIFLAAAYISARV